MKPKGETMYTPYNEPKNMFQYDGILPIEDLQRQLTRIETRLVKLMHHMGLDTQGNPHLDAYGDPL